MSDTTQNKLYPFCNALPTTYEAELRDYLAAATLQGMLANPHQHPGEWDDGKLARWSYATADAMLAERQKGGNQ